MTSRMGKEWKNGRMDRPIKVSIRMVSNKDKEGSSELTGLTLRVILSGTRLKVVELTFGVIKGAIMELGAITK